MKALKRTKIGVECHTDDVWRSKMSVSPRRSCSPKLDYRLLGERVRNSQGVQALGSEGSTLTLCLGIKIRVPSIVSPPTRQLVDRLPG